LVGILTNRDLRFVEDYSILISEVMTSEDLITSKVGTTLEEAQSVLQKYKIEKLPLIDENDTLRGLITIKDIEKVIELTNSAKDEHTRLLLVAAVRVTLDTMNRINKLAEAHIVVIDLDTANGHSQGVLDKLKHIRETYPYLDIIAGNVETAESTRDLIE